MSKLRQKSQLINYSTGTKRSKTAQKIFQDLASVTNLKKRLVAFTEYDVFG
jgi:hypothetical protein